jgi:hypothetical protein
VVLELPKAELDKLIGTLQQVNQVLLPPSPTLAAVPFFSPLRTLLAGGAKAARVTRLSSRASEEEEKV